MSHYRISWPQGICLAACVLGGASTAACWMAGERTLAFLAFVASVALATICRELAANDASARVTPVNVVDFRRASDTDIPDYEAHQLLETRVLCAHSDCGQMGTLREMTWDPSRGHVCKTHGRATNPQEAA